MKFITSILSWVAPGVGGVVNPMVLLGIAAAAAVVFGAGSVAGWTANGWRLGAELADQKTHLVAMTAQAQVCAGKLRDQSEAVDVMGSLGKLITDGNRATVNAIERNSKRDRAEIADLHDLLRQPVPKRADGSDAGCTEAWTEIAKRRGAK